MVGSTNQQPAPVGGFDPLNIYAQPHWRADQTGIAFDPGDHLVFRHVAFRIAAVIGHAGQAHIAVGKLKAQGIPAFRAPTLPHAGPFQQHVLPALLLKAITHDEAGLAGPDHDGIDTLHG